MTAVARRVVLLLFKNPLFNPNDDDADFSFDFVFEDGLISLRDDDMIQLDDFAAAAAAAVVVGGGAIVAVSLLLLLLLL